MSYDLEHIEKACPCPCGKGRIIYGWGTNDWNQIREGMIEIECPDCCKKYRFTNGGLLPKEFPEFHGDDKAYKEMERIRSIMSGLSSGNMRSWSDEKTKKRIQMLLTDEEIEEDKRNRQNNNLSLVWVFSRELTYQYSFDDLELAKKQIMSCKYSTRLNGIAKDIAYRYKRRYNSIKLSKVIVPVLMAIRNYKTYREFELEDEEEIKQLHEELEKVEAIYYKGYSKYNEKREKLLIRYALEAV